MPEKLLTLNELSRYLGISEEKIISLVEKRIISAYKIGGELLRFRKDQIDAIRTEINSFVGENDRVAAVRPPSGEGKRAFSSDFFYFYDFYIVSGLIIFILLITIIFVG